MVGQGYHTLNAMSESHIKINTQFKSCSLGYSSILTKDCITLQISSYVTFSVSDVEKAFKLLGKSEHNYDQLVRSVALGTLKNIVGDFTME